MLPEAAQGALALQVRAGEHELDVEVGRRGGVEGKGRCLRRRSMPG